MIEMLPSGQTVIVRPSNDVAVQTPVHGTSVVVPAEVPAEEG